MRAAEAAARPVRWLVAGARNREDGRPQHGAARAVPRPPQRARRAGTRARPAAQARLPDDVHAGHGRAEISPPPYEGRGRPGSDGNGSRRPQRHPSPALPCLRRGRSKPKTLVDTLIPNTPANATLPTPLPPPPL